MLILSKLEIRKHWRLQTFLIITLLAEVASGQAVADILWSGDFETGNFVQWHLENDNKTPNFWGIPPHGRPIAPSPLTGSMSASYYGDGSLAQIVTSPVRQGKYAAKFTALTSQSGSEPEDCDGANPETTKCHRRRTELRMNRALPLFYNAMPYLAERWMSVSQYVPTNWDSVNGQGFGPIVFQVKPLNESGLSPCLAIQLTKKGWEIRHIWSDVVNPARDDIPWQQAMYYDAVYPSPNGGDTGADLRADFPNQSESQAALANFNKGGWSDWVIRIRYDARGSANGGQGHLTVWKRAGAGAWIEIVNIKPRRINRGGMTFDRGVCYNSPASGSNPGGFGLLAGMYMDKDQVWNLPANRVIYNDNVKVGSDRSAFAEMSPDGSSPGSLAQSAPQPPELSVVE
jgi:hypothetical protein